MPTMDFSSTCRTDAASRPVTIRLPVPDEAMNLGYLEGPTPLVARVNSGWDGFYPVRLPPGNYSFFVDDGGREYCRMWFRSEACIVVVPQGTRQEDPHIDHAAY